MSVGYYRRGRQERRESDVILYEGIRIEAGYRIDLLVDGLVIVGLKSVAELCPLYEAQLLTYLKLSGRKVGLLMNFNVMQLKDGIKRIGE